MNISGLLGTFASSLSFYIDEFERIVLHISANLPIVSNQIESHVSEARKVQGDQNELIPSLNNLLDDMSAVRVPIYEIILELQKQDIINQQMDHLLTAVGDVQKIVDENKDLFVEYDQKKNLDDYRDEYRHLFTLISFLLNSIEKHMTRINGELIELIDTMELRFSEIQKKITSIHSGKKSKSLERNKLIKSIQSVMTITENLSNELQQYNNFFERLRLLQSDMDREVSICSGLKKEVDEDLDQFGGILSLTDCRFSNSIIQKIVDKLSVEEERQSLREEFSELKIEKSADDDVILF